MFEITYSGNFSSILSTRGDLGPVHATLDAALSAVRAVAVLDGAGHVEPRDDGGWALYASPEAADADADGSDPIAVVAEVAVTDEQIETLRDEAGVAGDHAMAATCTDALHGDDVARRVCVRAIRAAEAMA